MLLFSYNLLSCNNIMGGSFEATSSTSMQYRQTVFYSGAT